MVLTNLKRLKTLMVIHDDMSARKLARIAGYASHTYVQRLLKGEVKTMKTEPALRIANHFKVPVEDLFMVEVTSNPGSRNQGKGMAA